MLVVDEPKYKMAIYEDKKEVHIQVIGFIPDELVEPYLIALEQTANKVNRSQYTFVIDATHQAPLPSKTSAGLGGTLMFYASFGFKNYWIIYPTSKIATVQIRNALETINFPGKAVFKASEIK